MVREIVLLGDPVLRRKAKPIKAFDRQASKLLDDLLETMEDASGLGLAAPQIGIAKRAIVAQDGEGELVMLINPQILSKRGSESGTEGCLSMPGLYGTVERAKRVVVAGIDRTGREVKIEAQGLLARALQHEIDHVNGVLFTDHTDELWWNVRVSDDEPDDPSHDVIEHDDGETVRLKQVSATLAEAEEHFDSLRQAEKELG